MVTPDKEANRLQHKKILLAISGGIAAYKSAELVRRLSEHGAQVRVVMTEAALAFMTPLTFQALSGHPVATDLLDPTAEAAMGHIELAKWADLILLAPASADIIARAAHGLANDLLTTLLLASAAPQAFAPAMNQQMYHHPATQANLQQLRQRQCLIWGPAEGQQACGDVGFGRMLEPTELLEHCIRFFHSKALADDCPPAAAVTSDSHFWQNKRILITAGPTHEAIDPVRYLANRSSGKMGFALAQTAAELGAKVTLISGPVSLATPENVERIDVTSAQQMHQRVMEHISNQQLFIACAAVADFRAATTANQKIKKQPEHDTLTLSLIKNPDILAEVASLTENRPFVVGFAAETEQLTHHAQLKRLNKKADLICANDVSQSQIGFESDLNQLYLCWAQGDTLLALSSKKQLSQQIFNQIQTLMRTTLWRPHEKND